jgi:hypothetical protein
LDASEHGVFAVDDSGGSGAAARWTARFRFQFWKLEDAHHAARESADRIEELDRDEGDDGGAEDMDGRGQLEKIEADGAPGHFEGMTVFLYSPQSRQWSQDFASSVDGSLETPLIGEFKGGRGELVSQEQFKGKTILVRGVWSEIKADSHRFEQAFSDDGGKTWEPNFVATLTRAAQ